MLLQVRTSTWSRASCLLALLWAAAPAMGSAAEPLRVGMDTRSRPWAFVPGLDYSKEDWSQAPRVTADELRRLEGVDVDFMKALAGRLGRGAQVVPWAWESIEDGLLSKAFDLLINAWVPSDRTPPEVVASAPYYEWGLLVVARADDPSIQSYRDLKGRRVGHFQDRVVGLSVWNLGAGTLVPLDDSDMLFDHLAAGKVDAVVEDSTYVRWRVARDPGFRIVGDRLNRHGYHVGLRREDRELLARVQAAIEDLVSSGEMDRIRARWESPAAAKR
jgi:polar amino acid transport system substrate-binding protein